MNNRPPHSLKKQLLVQNKLEERYCYIKTVIEFAMQWLYLPFRRMALHSKKNPFALLMGKK